MGFSAWPLATSLAETLAETPAGTQIGVPICFTEYPQPSSLAAELWTPCCPLHFVGHETLCYQRVTHTATPRLESRLHVSRQSLSRKVLWPISLATCMNFASGFHGVRLRFVFFGDSERTAELCASDEGGAVVVEAWLHILSASRRSLIH